MNIDDALILKLEKLAKLKLSKVESNRLKNELEKVIDMFSLIAEVDTEGVEPLRYLNDQENVLREDVAKKGISFDEVKKNAPKVILNQFAVPKVIE